FLVEPSAEQRRHACRDRDIERERAQHDEAEQRRIDKHHRKEDPVKNRSITSVSAELVRKLRMFSNSRTRATESPTRRAWKYASGNATRWRNSRAPSSTSMRLVVCENR